MALDFAELADGVRKNNMGLGGFKLKVKATVSGSSVRLEPTGQMFQLAGKPPPGNGLERRSFKVLNWDDRAGTKLEALPPGQD